MGPSILQINNLKTRFHTSEGILPAVDGVSFAVEPGKVLGLVGESGSGKTVTALSVMRLIPDPPGRITGGEVLFDNQDLLAIPDEEMRRVRGRRISMIFQEPMTSLNPVFTVGNQISEMLRLHLNMSRKEALDRSIELLNRVGIPSASRRVAEYPHQLSGGMRQRVMIAMAISCNPEVVFADEPTTALDVTIQAQILVLLQKLREQLGMAMVLISHDLGVIAETADEVAIMYAGKIVETADTKKLYAAPAHPYTKGLLASIPHFDETGKRKGRLTTIPGTVPKLSELPAGCKFAPRCPEAVERCLIEDPPLKEIEAGHTARCWVAFGEAAG
ncbi:MAG TPA: ABC transporter ATP-binding protein [Nitrospiria bacterium]|nr:ABC transporter ATP-binding protein [Nitrospiria bacterium]